MSIPNTHVEGEYYAKLDTLFATATAIVILFCLMSLPFLPFTPMQRWQFVGVLMLAAVFFVVRYLWLRRWQPADYRFYVSDVVNPIITGLLISAAGRFGLYLFFLFALVLVSSIAILRFRHVALNALLVAGYSFYLFFLSNTFGLDESEQFLAGGIAMVVLLLITVFTYVLMHEMLAQLTDLEAKKLDFIQDVSHELRTPLTVIKTSTQLLLDSRLGRLGGKMRMSKDVVKYLESATVDLEKVTERLSRDSKRKVKGG